MSAMRFTENIAGSIIICEKIFDLSFFYGIVRAGAVSENIVTGSGTVSVNVVVWFFPGLMFSSSKNLAGRSL